jgi:methyl farnesoate epoxidase/farnesoate epoxidase
MSGIYEIMHDVEYWGDPEVYRPERFIDLVTGKFKSNERLVPFGFGKRICIGSTLAQNELYLFLSAFLQHFEFSDPIPEILEPVTGFLLGCPDFTLKIHEKGDLVVGAADKL